MTLAQRWRLISGGLALLALLVSVWRLWTLSRDAAPLPAGLARRCRQLILEHPQSAGLLILTALALPVPLALFGWAVSGLWTQSTGLYGFLLLAPVSALVTAGLAAAAGVTVALMAARRLAGERARFDLLFSALFGATPRLAMAGLSRLLTGDTEALSWFSAAVVLIDDCDAAAAGQRARAFLARAPGAEALHAPMRWRAILAAGVAAGGPMPLFFGFSSLPILAFAGYRMQFLLELEYFRYTVSCAVLGVLFCAALIVMAVRLGAALVHAVAIYLLGTGAPAQKERVLARFSPEWVLPPAVAAAAQAAAAPQSASAAQAPVSAQAPAAPAPAAAARVESVPSTAEPTPAAPQPPAVLPAALPVSMPLGSAAAPQPVSADDAQWMSAVRPRAETMAAPLEETPASVWPVLMRGALRMGLLLVLGAAVFISVRLLDGAAFLRRERLRSSGQLVNATVEDVQAQPMLGQLFYRLTFVYAGRNGPLRAQALAGEGVSGRLLRGSPVLVRVNPRDPADVCLEEDYGYSRDRGALLLGVLALLIVGGWSFIFRVI